MHNFLYSLTICLLHYYPRHVSSIYMHILRRKNCIHTASGIFALCKRLTVHWLRAESALNQFTVQTFTENEDTRCCVNTIFPPEDEHVNTFAASYLNTQGLNNSYLKSPASTLVDLTFQSRALRSFS